MNWPYQIRPYLWPSGLTIVCLVGLSVYAWRRRSVPGALQFVIACLLAALWASGSLMELAATDAASKILWFKLHTFLQLPSITAATAFLLEYAQPGKWLTRRNIALLSVMPVLLVVVGLTADVHHLVWRSLVIGNSVSDRYTPLGLVFIAYSLWLGLVNIAVMVWMFVRSRQHRWPAALIITAQIISRTTFALEAIYVINSDLPLDLLEISFVFLTYAIVLFGFHFLDPVLLARQAAMEYLYIGMVVLDRDGRVKDLNLSAQRILMLPAARVKGRLFRELLPAYSDMQRADAAAEEIELSLGTGKRVRNYAVAASSLVDWRGIPVGRLLLLRDVTDQNKVQAQLLEQARALAVLQERDRVARELHDDLGQVLGYVKLQTQTARDHLARDQANAADNDLAQLAAVVQDVHADVREYILGARSGNHAETGFLPALEQFLRRFGDSNRIRTELIAPPELAEGVLEPMVEVQLLRIIQEALTNTRKHANATWVRVSIALLDERAQITVQDNGVGFDPAELANGEGQRFGLQFMRERASGIGGSVEIDTQPGAGTRAVIFVPLSPHIQHTMKEFR